MYHITLNSGEFNKNIVLKILNYLVIVFDQSQLKYNISFAIDHNGNIMMVLDGENVDKLRDLTLKYGQVLLKQLPLNELVNDEKAIIGLKQHLDFIALELKLLDDLARHGYMFADDDNLNFGTTDKFVSSIFKAIGEALSNQ